MHGLGRAHVGIGYIGRTCDAKLRYMEQDLGEKVPGLRLSKGPGILRGPWGL